MLLLLIVTFIFASCGNRTKENNTAAEFTDSTNEEYVEEVAEETFDETTDEIKETAQEIVEVVEEVSAEWNDLLDEYEAYIDDYIACVKKVAKGDISAMTEMVKLLEDAQGMTDKISEVSENLTASQATRYAKLNKKLLDAAAEM